MMVLSSEYAEYTSGEDGFQIILGEVRFINDMLHYGRRRSNHYILPDGIMYDLKDINIDGSFTKIAQIVLGESDEESKPVYVTKLAFFKYDSSALIISFAKGYLGAFKNRTGFATPYLDRMISSFYAFSALVLLRCKSVISQLPQDFFVRL